MASNGQTQAPNMENLVELEVDVSFQLPAPIGSASTVDVIVTQTDRDSSLGDDDYESYVSSQFRYRWS